MTETRNTRKTLRGVVTAAGNEKTVTVSVDRYTQHGTYSKRVKVTKKYLVHDEANAANVGDTVKITECRPMSARKRFRLVKITETAEKAEVK